MLDENEYELYMGENVMILNPVERYMKNKGKEEGMKEGKLEVAGNLLDGYFKSLIALNVFG